MAAKGIARVGLVLGVSLVLLWVVVATVQAQPVGIAVESTGGWPVEAVPTELDLGSTFPAGDSEGGRVSSPGLVGTVNIALSPSATTVYVGDIFLLDVMVNAGSQSVDGVDVYLNFDAGKLHVVDATGADATEIIADTTTFSTILQNTADNTNGYINYSAGSFSGGGGSGSFRVAQIRFKALAGSTAAGTPLTFNRTIPRLTDAAWQGLSVFGSATDGSVVVRQTFTIPLTTGWNLISTPLSPVSPSVTTTLMSIAGHYDLVYAYDAFDPSDPWKVYDTAAPPVFNTLKEITESIGFWIRMLDPETLTVTGTLPMPPAISLATGWNLVGYPSLVTRPIAEALSTINGKYDLVYHYDAFDSFDPWKVYDTASPPVFNTLTQMVPGWGYWIRTNQACVWTLP